MITIHKKIWKRVFFVMLCLTVSIKWNMLCVSAEDDEKEEDPIIIVSLGDSYSSGEGIEPFYGQDEDIESKVNNPDWLAHRSTKSWPSLLRVEGLEGTLSDYKDENWFFAAASGAVTDNLIKKQNKDYDREGYSGTYRLVPQLNVFDEFEKDTVDYVTLTFGGNDVGFTDIITAAAMNVPFARPTKLIDMLNTVWDDFYAEDGIEDDIRRAYEEIADKAGSSAKIIVAGYPKLLKQTGSGVLFSPEEAQRINSNVTKFNQALSAIVDSCHDSGMSICFVSVEDAFDGHEAYTEEAYINEIILGSRSQDLTDKLLAASAYSIHPNARGAEAYASCVQAKIDELEAGLEEEPTEETEEDHWLLDEAQEKLDEEIEKQQQKVVEWLQNKIERWLNQWLAANCGC